MKKILVFCLALSLFFGYAPISFGANFSNFLKDLFQILPFKEKRVDEFQLKQNALKEAINLNLENLQASKVLFENFLKDEKLQESLNLSSSSLIFFLKATNQSLKFASSEIGFFLEEKERAKKALSLKELITIKFEILIHRQAKKSLNQELQKISQILEDQKIIEIAKKRLKKINEDLNQIKDGQLNLFKELFKLSENEILLAENLLKKEVLLYLFKKSLKEKNFDLNTQKLLERKIRNMGIKNFSLKKDKDLKALSFQIRDLIEKSYQNFETMADLTLK